MSTPQIIYNQCLKDGLPSLLSVFVVSQLASETAVNGIPFSSHVFVSCNNTGGYKWKGQSTAEGACLLSPEGDYYAKYTTIADSVHEITQWIRRRQADGTFPADLNEIQTPQEYAYWLKNADYYTDTLANYSRNLSSWFDVFKVYPFTTTGKLFGTLLFFGGLYLLYRNRRQLFNKKMSSIFE